MDLLHQSVTHLIICSYLDKTGVDCTEIGRGWEGKETRWENKGREMGEGGNKEKQKELTSEYEHCKSLNCVLGIFYGSFGSAMSARRTLMGFRGLCPSGRPQSFIITLAVGQMSSPLVHGSEGQGTHMNRERRRYL